VVAVSDRHGQRRPLAVAGDAHHGHARFGQEPLAPLLGHPLGHVYSWERSCVGCVNWSARRRPSRRREAAAFCVILPLPPPPARRRGRRPNPRSLSVRLSTFVSFASSKSRFPLPTVMGKTISRNSSIWSWCMRAFTSSPLPKIKMSLPGCCFSLRTFSTTFPFISVELFHSSGSSNVGETPYFG
jgi:hypothetical protein